jgi:hypothetical protein
VQTPSNTGIRPNPGHLTTTPPQGDRNYNRNDHRNNAYVIPWWWQGYGFNNYWGDNGYWGDNPNNPNSYNPNNSVNQQPQQAAAPAPNATGPIVTDQSSVDQVRLQALAQLKASPQWQELSAQMVQAQNDVTADQARIHEDLMKDPAYKAAYDAKHRVESTAQAAQAAHHESPAQLEPLGRQDLAHSKTLTDMERDAMSKDSHLQDAQERLQKVTAQRNALLAQTEAQIAK